VPPPEVPPPEAPPTPAARPAAWPLWHAGADTALVILAVGLAFLVASFAARNSDLWLHLGAGRMLTTGEYSLGSDPLSFTAADRPWVNHAWLFDLGTYLLYRGDGFALVLAKALAVAGAVALLVGIRRPGHALWPWAAVAAVAVVAAAPRLTLNPLVGSVLFLAATLFLVFRLPSPPGSWRLPAAIGVTFWLWANTDAWFFTGPAALALLLAGELVRTKGLNAEGPATPPDDPLGPLPDAATLAKALGVGVLACMLNPHHVRVWDLPFELTGGAGADDPRLAQLLYSPLTGTYWENVGLGYNANGAAFVLLLAGGLYAAAVTAVVGRLAGRPWDVEPLPLPHAFLWFGFAGLALMSFFAVPFLAAVSVPLLAGRLNALSARVTLGSVGDARTRLVLTLSALGRVVSVLGLVALGVCAWPGWLHPTGANPAFARRVAWEVTPDPGLARAAAKFGDWRTAGLLGPDDRGFVGSLDLANYLAWYAPGEKVFANGRYNHHRAEWPAFTKARLGLGAVRTAEGMDLRDAAAVLDAHKLTYAAVSAAANDSVSSRLLAKEASHRMWVNPDRWAAWYLDGRTAVCGWRSDPGVTPPTFEKLRVNPLALAFGPAAERLPAGPGEPVPAPRVWLDDFTRPARPSPPAADEALAWMEYREMVGRSRQADVYQLAALLLRAAPPAPPPLLANLFQFQLEGAYRGGQRPYVPPSDGSFAAISILALKAARKAVADNPDHPDGYFTVARALTDPGLPLNDSERVVGMVVALRQSLSRFPPPDEFVPGVYASSPTQTAQELASLYAGNAGNPQARGIPGIPVDLPGLRELTGMIVRGQGGQPVVVPYHYPVDLAHEAIALAMKYGERELAGRPDEPREVREYREQKLRGLKQQADRFQATRQQATDQYRRAAEQNPKAKARFELAVRANLTGEAIRLVKDTPGQDLEREFGADMPDVVLKVIALELVVGRAEDAAADAAELRLLFDRMSAQPPPPPGVGLLRGLLRRVDLQTRTATGDYETAGRELEAIDGGLVVPGSWPPGVRPPPPRWPAVSVVPSLDTTAWLAVFGIDREIEYAQFQQIVLQWKRQESEFFFRRGMLSLLEGDVDAARERFRASWRPPLTEWKLPAVQNVNAPFYLRLINAARK
jgi:hypothetical protein